MQSAWPCSLCTYQDIETMLGSNKVWKLEVVIKFCITQLTMVSRTLPYNLDFCHILQAYREHKNVAKCASRRWKRDNAHFHHTAHQPVARLQLDTFNKDFTLWMVSFPWVGATELVKCKILYHSLVRWESRLSSSLKTSDWFLEMSVSSRKTRK